MTIENTQQRLAEDCARHMYENDPASQTMGMEIKSISPGCATVMMIVREDMLNGHKTCHGGNIFSLADSAFAFACNSYNQAAVAASCTIDFLHPSMNGDQLTAIAKMVHQGNRTGIYNVRVTNQNEKLIALFKGNSSRIKRNVLSD